MLIVVVKEVDVDMLPVVVVDDLIEIVNVVDVLVVVLETVEVDRIEEVDVPAGMLPNACVMEL